MCFNQEVTQRRSDGETQARRYSARGFSFIEVMVVVMIIGLLAGAVAINVRSRIDKAKVNRARSDIATIVNALESYYAEHGKYPGNEEGLESLDLKGFIDPWNRPYQYNQPGSAGPFEVLSYGADGQEGGSGADADVTSDQIAGGGAEVAERL